jgi:hypothetical protein
MENKKQVTAIECLVEEINKLTGLTITMDEPCIEQAKELHKQQIIDAHCDGQSIEDTSGVSDAKDYYNETFNK